MGDALAKKRTKKSAGEGGRVEIQKKLPLTDLNALNSSEGKAGWGGMGG